MGFFDFFKSKKNEQMGFVSDNKQKGMSFEEANALRDSFLSIMSQDDRSKQFNAAAGMLLKKAYDPCIEAYTLLGEKYPDELGLCESQIGAAYYFKEEYEKAVEYYVAAMNHGSDASMMDDNIWEAYEVLYQKTQDKSYIEKYKALFPNGSYISKANKILR